MPSSSSPCLFVFVSIKYCIAFTFSIFILLILFYLSLSSSLVSPSYLFVPLPVYAVTRGLSRNHCRKLGKLLLLWTDLGDSSIFHVLIRGALFPLMMLCLLWKLKDIPEERLERYPALVVTYSPRSVGCWYSDSILMMRRIALFYIHSSWEFIYGSSRSKMELSSRNRFADYFVFDMDIVRSTYPSLGICT